MVVRKGKMGVVIQLEFCLLSSANIKPNNEWGVISISAVLLYCDWLLWYVVVLFL